MKSEFSQWVGLGTPFACVLLGMSVLCLQPHCGFQEEDRRGGEEKGGRKVTLMEPSPDPPAHDGTSLLCTLKTLGLTSSCQVWWPLATCGC